MIFSASRFQAPSFQMPDPPCIRMYCKIFIWSRNVERSRVTKRGPCFSGQPWVPGTYVFAPQNSLWTKAPANKIAKQTFNQSNPSSIHWFPQKSLHLYLIDSLSNCGTCHFFSGNHDMVFEPSAMALPNWATLAVLHRYDSCSLKPEG